MTFDEYWRELKSSGWLEAYSDERVRDLRARLHRCFELGTPDMTVYELDSGELDPKAILNADYGSILLEWHVRASGGKFAPTNIFYERLPNESCRLRFNLGGARFERELPYFSGELEDAARALCNEALESTASPYRFFEVGSGLAFVRPSAYEKLERLGFVTICELAKGSWGAALPGIERSSRQPTPRQERVRSTSSATEIRDPRGGPKRSSRRRARFASRPMCFVFGLQLVLLRATLSLGGISPKVLGVWLVLIAACYVGARFNVRRSMLALSILMMPACWIVLLVYRFWPFSRARTTAAAAQDVRVSREPEE